MKSILKLALPLTVIVFILFTKWWIVQIVDGPDYIMYGFPFIYKSPAFHTSMAFQYFFIELFVDLFIYFSIIFIVLCKLKKHVIIWMQKKIFITLIYLTMIVLLGFEIVLVTALETNISFKRDFGIELIEKTGFEFPFNNNDWEEYDKIHQKF